MGPDSDMDSTREEMRTLMSGYLDHELEPDEVARFEAYLEAHADFREELDRMGQLVDAASDLGVESLPDEVWDTFLDGVYNRLERRTGWMAFLLGVALLSGAGVYWFVVSPWASPTMKAVAALPLAGLGVLFGSVLRERLFVLKTDRYSRDVKR